MLMTDVGDEMCWCQLKDFGDGFGYFGSQYVASITYHFTKRQAQTFKIYHQDQNSVTNIENFSLTLSHQHHDVTNTIVIIE